ncbi:hypothetical protein SAMN04487898_106296 [Pedobacter sp. ok626]|uniref:YcxB family protein n=1 Tax=Pedobacter sp. ok626 TaxID=1761882 RepID=UPI0008828C5A|nr:YcxB family protein [Pedobacter sp. ok626]SDK19877.1 hypothetical protein SAMN04487898_106296 [Pedobacter sp. ok626]
MYTYTLSKDDLLIFLQHYTSTTGRLKRGRKTMWFLATYFVILSAICFYIDSNVFAIILLVVAALYVLTRNLFMKYSINKALKLAAVTELSGMADSPIQLEINQDHLHIIDLAGDYKYKFSGIILISEIADHFLINLNNSQTLIIPKISTSLCDDIKKAVTTNNLPFLLDLDWKW